MHVRSVALRPWSDPSRVVTASGCLVAFAMCSLGSAARAQTAAILGKWIVSQAHSSCAMYENEPDAFDYFSLTPTGKYYLRVHHKGWEIASGKHALSLSINDETLPVTGFGVKTTNGWSGFSIEVPRSAFDEVRSASSFTLTEMGLQKLRISFPPAAQAVDAVFTCQANVIANTAPGTKFAENPPIPDTSNWVSKADYPRDALEHRQSGSVGYILSVDATGSPSDCKIVTSSGVPDLDIATCTILLAHAHFWPARAHDGSAVADTYQSRIQWTLP